MALPMVTRTHNTSREAGRGNERPLQGRRRPPSLLCTVDASVTTLACLRVTHTSKRNPHAHPDASREPTQRNGSPGMVVLVQAL